MPVLLKALICVAVHGMLMLDCLDWFNCPLYRGSGLFRWKCQRPELPKLTQQHCCPRTCKIVWPTKKQRHTQSMVFTGWCSSTPHSASPWSATRALPQPRDQSGTWSRMAAEVSRPHAPWLFSLGLPKVSSVLKGATSKSTTAWKTHSGWGQKSSAHTDLRAGHWKHAGKGSEMHQS